VVCFFVNKRFRRKGLALKLLEAAVEYAAKQGGSIVEGYPIEAGAIRMADAFAYTGLASAFRKAGFAEVLRRSESRPVMRYVVRK
jgi:GNAT superfamily N-acetyltransferase